MKMKLLLSFIAIILGTMHPMWAQTDVTNLYIVNPGFDSGITYNASSTGNLGSANGGTNIRDVEGWPVKVYGDNSAAAIFSFGSQMNLNVLTDNVGCLAPAIDQNGNSTGGVLGISSAWSASNYYAQTVTLPAGKYRVAYATYNSGPNATNNRSLVGWYPVSGSTVTSNKTYFALDTWETDSLTFTLATETVGEIRVGLGCNGVGSGSTGRVFFDYIKLYYLDTSSIVPGDEPVDMTEYIINPNFSSNSKDGWDISGTFAANQPAVSYDEMEAWNSTFNISQTITKLPAGIYRLTADGFHRYAANAVAQPTHLNGTEAINAVLYARTTDLEKQTPFHSLYSVPSPSVSGSLWTATDGSYYVNGMNSARAAFDLGHYKDITVDNIVVHSDDTLTIGVKTLAPIIQDSWTIWDNFRLTYIAPLHTNPYVVYLEEKIKEAENMVLNTSMLHTSRVELENTIVVAKGINTSDSIAVRSGFLALENEVNTAYEHAEELRLFRSGPLAQVASIAANTKEYSSQVTVLMSEIAESINTILNSDTIECITIHKLAYQLEPMASFAKTYQLADNQLSAFPDSLQQVLSTVMDEQYQLVRGNYWTAESAEIKITATLGKIRFYGIIPNENADVTFVIVNPTAEAVSTTAIPEGWSIENTGAQSTLTSQHWSGDTNNRYFDSYNATPGALKFTANQVIKGIPNGTYKLVAAARSSGNGAYLYACGDTLRSTKIPADGTTLGGIFNSAEEDSSVKAANNGNGWGWNWVTVDQILVTHNELTIGFTNVPSVTGGASWNGSWFSVDDFKLYWTEAEDLSQETLLRAKAMLMDSVATASSLLTSGIQYLPGGVQLNLQAAIQSASAVVLKSDSILKERDVLSKAMTDARISAIYWQLLQPYYEEYDSLKLQVSIYPSAALAQAEQKFQMAFVILKLPTSTNTIFASVEQEAIKTLNELKKSGIPGTNPLNFSFLIENPQVNVRAGESVPYGWTVQIENGIGFCYKNGEHYSNDPSNTYLDAYNATNGKLNYDAYTLIEDIPNGKYLLRAAGRSSSQEYGAYFYASTSGAILKTPIPADGNTGGGMGNGWNQMELPVMVKDGTLTFGVTNRLGDWSGLWFSIDDFELWYVSADTNLPMPAVIPADSILATEHKALETIYAQMNGSNWETSWNLKAPQPWKGVTLLDGHVVRLELPSNAVSGTIPTAVNELKRLVVLDLSGNAIEGTIPALDSLKRLVTLNISSNKIHELEKVLPINIKNLSLGNQQLTLDSIILTSSPVVNMPSIVRYDHASQRLDLRSWRMQLSDSCNQSLYVAPFTGSYINYYSGESYGEWTDPSGTLYHSTIYSDNDRYTATVRICFLKGDANADLLVDILDVQRTLNYIFEDYTRLFNFAAANTYPDNLITVQDVVRTVDLILAEPLPNVVASSFGRRYLQEDENDMSNILTIENDSLVLYAINPVAAMDITLSGVFANQVVDLLYPLQFQCVSRNVSQGVRLMYFTLSENTLPVGRTVIAALQAPGAEVSHADLSSKDATRLPVKRNIVVTDLGNSTLEDAPFRITEELGNYQLYVPTACNQLQLKVYTADGTGVREMDFSNVPQGVYDLQDLTSSLPQGTYLIQITAVSNTLVVKQTERIAIK